MTPARTVISLLTAAAAAATLTACAQAGAGMQASTVTHPRKAVAAVPVTHPATQPAPPTTPAQAGAQLNVLVNSPCFGAASNTFATQCARSVLTRGAYPPPSVAAATPNAACNSRVIDDGLYTCWFGAQRHPTRTIALVGDSHAAMWRATLAPIARAEGWRGVSIVHPGCPFSAITRDEGGPLRNAACGSWRVQIIPWLRQHPEISLMFVGALSDSPFLGQTPASNFDAAVAGYRQIWSQVPHTVKHIVVMRDTPRFGIHSFSCIRGAIAVGQAPGDACSLERNVSLKRDPEAVAAMQLNTPRIQIIDVDNQMCDRHECRPVIGGALVLKDVTHMTRTFARTLAPAVKTRLDQLVALWDRPA